MTMMIAVAAAADVYAVRHQYADANCTLPVKFDEMYYWGECWPGKYHGVQSIKWKGADAAGVTECHYDRGLQEDDGCTVGERCTIVPFGKCITHLIYSTPRYFKWRRLDSVDNGYTRIAYNDGLDNGGVSRSCASTAIQPVDGRLPPTLPAEAYSWSNVPPREYFEVTDPVGGASPNASTCYSAECNEVQQGLPICPVESYSSIVRSTTPSVYDKLVLCPMVCYNYQIQKQCGDGANDANFIEIDLDYGLTCQRKLHPGSRYAVRDPYWDARYSKVLPNPDMRGSVPISSAAAVDDDMTVQFIITVVLAPTYAVAKLLSI